MGKLFVSRGGPEFVKWFGRLRRRILGKTKYYNRVRWALDEGYSIEKAEQMLRLEKLEPLRQKLDALGVHGRKRKNALCGKSRQIRAAIKQTKIKSHQSKV